MGSLVLLLWSVLIRPASAAVFECWSTDVDTAYNVCLRSHGSCAGTWSDAFERALARWNQAQGVARFTVFRDTVNEIGPRNHRNETAWLDRSTADALYGPTSPNAIAVNYYWARGCGSLIESDIIFYPSVTWTLSRDTDASLPEFYLGEVAIHEVGHSLAFDHDDRWLTVMNSATHVQPSLLGYPHVDERQALPVMGYPVSSYTDVALMNYLEAPLRNGTPTGTRYPTVTVSSSTLRPGDVITLDDLMVQNWSTTGPRAVEVEFVFSADQQASTDDAPGGSVRWNNVASTGAFGADPARITVPELPPATYYLIAVTDRAQRVVEAYENNNQWVMGVFFVDEPESRGSTGGGGGGGSGCSSIGASLGLGLWGVLLVALAGAGRARWVAIVAAWFVSTAAQATTLQSVDATHVVASADRVVLGTVEAVHQETWGPMNVPLVRVTLAVQETWKGLPTDRTDFVQTGGTLANGDHFAPMGARRFEVGQPVVAFLYEHVSGERVVVGLHVGVLDASGFLMSLPPLFDVTRTHPEGLSETQGLPFVGQSVAEARTFVRAHRDVPRPASLPPRISVDDWFRALREASSGVVRPAEGPAAPVTEEIPD